MFSCKFCGKEFSKPSGKGLHEIQCINNPDRRIPQLGRKAWNAGLSKESDTRIKEHAEVTQKTMRQKFDSGYRTPAHGEYWTPEKRLEKSLWRKKLHADDPDSHPNRKLANNRDNMTYPELVCYNWLLENGIEFEHQKLIGDCYPDFVVGKLIIEIDGARFHDSEKDKQRDKKLNDMGYNVVRILSTERIDQRLEELFSVKR